MNAVPKRWFHDGDLKQIGWHANAEGVYIECEIVQPKSAEGRTVTVHFRGDEVEWLLRELRDLAIVRRSKPMEVPS